MGNLIAMITIIAASNIVLFYVFGWIGIPISVALTVLVYKKRNSKVIRPIAFAIGILIVVAGLVWIFGSFSDRDYDYAFQTTGMSIGNSTWRAEIWN